MKFNGIRQQKVVRRFHQCLSICAPEKVLKRIKMYPPFPINTQLSVPTYDQLQVMDQIHLCPLPLSNKLFQVRVTGPLEPRILLFGKNKTKQNKKP